jgi:peptide/nickel transport system substrate-binding protein
MKTIQGKCTPMAICLRFLLLAAFLVLPLRPASTAHAEDPSDPAIEPYKTIPRSQTLYFNGLQWNPVVCWNPYASGCNNAMAIAQQDNPRVTMSETPYLFNMLDGGQYPLLADGAWAWDAGLTGITFKLKTAAHWNDGTPLTADDVAYTWATHLKYGTEIAVLYKDYIETIEAVDFQTVLVKAKLGAGGKAANPLLVSGYLNNNYVVQKAWTQKLEARTGGNADLLKNDPALDVAYSGPYHKYLANAEKIVLIRDDRYWGQDASMWGRLPAPKYLAHVIYSNNDAGLAAFKAGQVDVSQQFIAHVQNLWLVDKLPVSTYLPDAPYGIGASLPTAFYNLGSYGLDQLAVRKAIAIAVDYDAIVANAMTNQSPTFTQFPRSIMNATTGEQDLYDKSDPAVQALQWAGNDITGAKAILNAAGIIDTNADGWREYNGTTLHYTATCPKDWTDWMAAIEIVASAGRAIGIDVTTAYPEWSIYQTVVTNWPLSSGYDIFMMWSDGAGPAEPWSRVRHLISSEFAGTTHNWNGDYGGYANPAADALIQAIPTETNPAMLETDYTELTKIYLGDIPSFTLMYRPQSFHTVNESYWTGFPHQGDGTDPAVPPLNLIDGWSIAGLYNLQAHSIKSPSVPSPLSPKNNALLNDTTPTLDWKDSSLPAGVLFDRYQLQVASDKAFTSIVLDLNIDGITNSNYTFTTDLSLNTGYYWRVRSFSPYGYASKWSSVRYFRIALPAPVNLNSDGSVQNLRPQFTWNMPSYPPPAATGYIIQVSAYADFSKLLLSGKATSSSYVPTTDLPRSQTPLYWRVAATGANGPGAWSASATFNTGNPPGIPNLLAPANNALLTTYTPLLDWSDSSVPTGAPAFDYYRVELADNAGFASPVIDASVAGQTNSSYTLLSPLAALTKYYWRVQACNINAECSSWSKVRTFRTK